MKNILVSIDFSSNGKKIALQAARLAKQAKARLILVNVYTAENTKKRRTKSTEAWAQTQLDTLAGKLYLATSISITRLLKPAFETDPVSELITYLKVDVAILYNPLATNFILIQQETSTLLQVATAQPLSDVSFKIILDQQLQPATYTSPPELLEAI